MNTKNTNTIQFADAEFMTADEKCKVLKAWIRFVKGGFNFKHFTKALYSHLTLHCSFIAHYNRNGFYDTYFSDPEDTLRFLGQFDRSQGCISVEYGSPYWITDGDYSDINSAMVDAVSDLLPEIKERLLEEELSNAQLSLHAAQARVSRLKSSISEE